MNKQTTPTERTIVTEKDILQRAKSIYTSSGIAKAIDFTRSIFSEQPSYIQLGILLSQFYQQNAQFNEMLALIRGISQRSNEQNILVSLRKCECLIYCGEISEAIATLDQLTIQAKDNDKVITKIAELYIHCSQFQKVELCHKKALAIKPNYSPYLYNLSFSKLTLGKISAAKQLVEKVIAQTPNDFDAYYSRSTINRVNKADNHIHQLKKILLENPSNKQAQISIGYALGKEYEDLGENELAFDVIEKAAMHRKALLSYKVTTDVDAIDTITNTFSKDKLDKIPSSSNVEQPIFVLGLPRSGTTLVEQILASHSSISSLGEVNCFAYSLMHTVGQNSGKLDLIKKSLTTDYKCLAQRYLHATKGFGLESNILIDKTPLNFLYIGLIKKALPNAKIIHLKREPLDSCFAMYKTLFRTGYPFSYSLNDLAQYYTAYHRLMKHWRSIFIDEIFDLNYSELVESPEKSINKLFRYCQLETPINVMNFYRNETPSATASAIQVRQPIYTSSVQKWKRYSKRLAPLKQQLESNGIECD